MRTIKKSAAVMITAALMLSWTVSAFAATKIYSTATPDQWMPQKYTGFSYSHDPMLDPRAKKDIIVDENAIYGYSPNPESDRLGEYASYDWSDPSVVWKARQDRLKYLEKDKELYAAMAACIAAGMSMEETAREVSHMRNVLRLESYENDPVGLEKVKKSNLKTYGNEEGPTADSLYNKYGSWEMVLQKAFSTNHGMDACLGLYDDNYFKYQVLGETVQ
ncbi:MAG: hypothetical protein IK139_03065 [Lachnospiraceae bacterium]|nr:hypothetical protein [Lachnospiraceae bacterium]